MTNFHLQLEQLRIADHLVAALPLGIGRRKLQIEIGKKLPLLLIQIQQVESAKGPTIELVPHSQAFCTEDAERPCQN